MAEPASASVVASARMRVTAYCAARRCSTCLRSLMSRTKALNNHAPSRRIGVIVSSTGISRPSRRKPVISMRWFKTGPSPLAKKCASPRSCASRWRGGMIVVDSFRPTTSDAGHPNTRSACELQLRTTPSPSMVMTASRAASMIAFSRASDARRSVSARLRSIAIATCVETNCRMSLSRSP